MLAYFFVWPVRVGATFPMANINRAHDDDGDAHLDESEEDMGSKRNMPSHVGMPGTGSWSHRLVDWSLLLIHLAIIIDQKMVPILILPTSTKAPSACW